MLLPPIRNAPVDVTALPVSAEVATCVPLTYRRCVVPSQVAARCDQVSAGRADGPRTIMSPVVNTCPLGWALSVLAYSAYTSWPDCSLSSTERQSLTTDGRTQAST